MSDLTDERLRELLIEMSMCADFEESGLEGETAEDLAAALNELMVLRCAIGDEDEWVHYSGIKTLDYTQDDAGRTLGCAIDKCEKEIER